MIARWRPLGELLSEAILQEEVRLFIEAVGWSKMTVTIDDGREEIIAWCTQNIGPQMGRKASSSSSLNECCWMAAVPEGRIGPVTYVFRHDKDAVHFKLRWYGSDEPDPP